MRATEQEQTVQIPAGGVTLEGDLVIPTAAQGIVVFAHGSGSSRHSPRNRYVAENLRQEGLGTLLMDLLTAEEERVDEHTRQLRFDIGMLAARLADAARWLNDRRETSGFPIGYFGASTGAGAALVAAVEYPDPVRAIVSRGGRPDLAGPALGKVRAPTLLIVGGYDDVVVEMNQDAYRQLRAPARVEIVPRATHLFEEPGALEQVARLARDWFVRWLPDNSH